MPIVELAGRGTVAYHWSGNGPEVIVLVNGSVFNYHQWDMQALPILHANCGQDRFLQYDYVGVGGSRPRQPLCILDLADELCDLFDALRGARPPVGYQQGQSGRPGVLSATGNESSPFAGWATPTRCPRGWKGPFPPSRSASRHWRRSGTFGPSASTATTMQRSSTCSMCPPSSPNTTKTFPSWNGCGPFIRRMIYPALEGTLIQTMVDLFRFYASDHSEEIPCLCRGTAPGERCAILLLNGTADTTTPVYMSRELVQVLSQAELVNSRASPTWAPCSSRGSQTGIERECLYARPSHLTVCGHR